MMLYSHGSFDIRFLIHVSGLRVVSHVTLYIVTYALPELLARLAAQDCRDLYLPDT